MPLVLLQNPALSPQHPFPMNKRRIIIPPESQTACYHVVSRCVDKAFKLGTEDKEQFVKAMRGQEAFSGVRVLTFCVLDNHFHLLLEVSPRPAVRPGVDDLFGRLGAICSRSTLERFRWHYDYLVKENRVAEAEVVLQRIWERTHDLSRFMQELKTRFTVSYNKRHQRAGTLWESRFHSTVVQTGTALQTMACYIDLNPLRAGIVERPEDYRWSGLTEGLHEVDVAVAGIGRLVELGAGQATKGAVSAYRMLVYGQGLEIRDDAGNVSRKGLTEEEISLVEASGGAMPVLDSMKRKVTWLGSGLVLGSKVFVQEVYHAVRKKVGWRREKRKVLEKEGLCVLGGDLNETDAGG
jgi:putative transposase